MPGDSDRNRVAERLREAYRDVVPTSTERQRHLTSIARTSPGMVPVPWRRRQGILEAVVILSVVVLVVGGISLWGALSRGERNTPQPTAVAASLPEPSPSPTASSCPETALATDLPSRMIGNPFYKAWYGNDGLWLSPVSVTGINPSLPATEARWFAGGIMVFAEWPFQANDTFVITGERLDGPSDPVSVSVPHDDFANNVSLDIPAPGCWEITASVRDLSLTIVANVLPQSERPDMRQAIERQTSQRPYPAPADCGPGWSGPLDRFGDYGAAYWIDLDGISIRSNDGVLWVNEPMALDWFPTEWDEITIDGQLADGGLRLGFATDHVHRVGAQARFWTSSLLFGAPGCWELTVTSGDVTASVNVWVYPDTCRHEPGTPLPEECRPPA